MFASYVLKLRTVSNQVSNKLNQNNYAGYKILGGIGATSGLFYGCYTTKEHYNVYSHSFLGFVAGGVVGTTLPFTLPVIAITTPLWIPVYSRYKYLLRKDNENYNKYLQQEKLKDIENTISRMNTRMSNIEYEIRKKQTSDKNEDD